jgi:hypothetical protein
MLDFLAVCFEKMGAELIDYGETLYRRLGDI